MIDPSEGGPLGAVLFTSLERLALIAALRAVIASAPGDPLVLLSALRKLEDATDA